MRRPATTVAVTLTAIGLALSATLPTVAQDLFDQPVDLTGGDVSVRTTGAPSDAGYFVAPDGSIQYRDSATDGSVPSGPAPAMPAAEMADRIVSAPMAADMFDAAPALESDAVTLQTLKDVFGGASIDASAPSGYAIENGAIVVNPPVPPVSAPMMAAPMMAAPMQAAPMQAAPVPDPMPMGQPVVETYSYTVTAPPMEMAPPLAPPAGPVMAAPIYAEPVMAAPMQAAPMQAAPMHAAPMHAAPMHAAPMHGPMTHDVIMAEPFIAAPVMSEPYPGDPYPGDPYLGESVTIDTVRHAPVVDRYASLAPTPLLSGSDFAAQGDGAYGPSTLKRAGDGPAGRDAAIFVSKSTIVELPVDAHEILVADPTRVRAVLRTARQMVLIGLQPGSTNVTAFDENGKQILNLDANIRYDLRPLRRALAATFPGVPVEIESVLGEVVVKGRANGVAEGEAIRDLVRRYLYSAMLGSGAQVSIENVQFVDRLTSATDDQILVKVRIAEMRRSVVKQFGVDFNLASDNALTSAAGSLARSVTDFGSISNSFGVNGAALGGIAANIAGSFESANFGALVRAFERHNVMRVLAEPTLTAVSGETASFLAGGQFPYPTSVDDGEIGFSFRDFGVALEFTPVVVGEGRISLTVATEISELTTEGALSAGELSIPGISIRKANTTVELPSGGTMSIAGMLLQRDASAHTGLPGLKNLPVIGQLFSSTDYQKQETELVILVTPYIVKPGQERDFRLPTDGFAPASDFDMFVLGRLHKVYGGAPDPHDPHAADAHAAGAQAALEAPFGFILE